MHRVEPYAVLCGDCGHCYTNSHVSRLTLSEGNYCPLCGTEYMEEDELNMSDYFIWLDENEQ